MSNQHEREIIAPNLLIHLELHTFTSSIPIKAFVGGAKYNFEYFKHTKFVCRLIFFYIFYVKFVNNKKLKHIIIQNGFLWKNGIFDSIFLPQIVHGHWAEHREFGPP